MALSTWTSLLCSPEEQLHTDSFPALPCRCLEGSSTQLPEPGKALSSLTPQPGPPGCFPTPSSNAHLSAMTSHPPRPGANNASGKPTQFPRQERFLLCNPRVLGSLLASPVCLSPLQFASSLSLSLPAEADLEGEMEDNLTIPSCPFPSPS